VGSTSHYDDQIIENLKKYYSVQPPKVTAVTTALLLDTLLIYSCQGNIN
jgi:hypothetical protein